MITKLTLEYDGSQFNGWARQPGLRTVQGELEGALERILGGARPVSVAGRTDKGVHAWGQVASYADEAVDPHTLNAVLSRDVAVLASEPQGDAFDARHSATTRTYCYRVLNRRARSAFEFGHALWVPYEIAREQLDSCAALLPGRHDFTAFTPTQTDHVRFDRDVRAASWSERDGVLEFWVEANSFMRQMNRVLVGTMLEVARGKRSVGEFAELLNGAPRSAAGDTAAPHGLYLAAVSYD